ncbi:hypothetical protein PENSUB_57 [Penicillium subrubescens]|uniref:Uncharacterized protein n=1 Tax=Penicillium subrubescens TaxID=1316194 RepID=A0A1Q5UPB0_9EURO|nr:hypothetical protein PENSUB_57 [Penicillium subrubescens]
MKLSILTIGAAALAGQAAAFHGSLAATPYLRDSSGLHQELFVQDYLTGSMWSARLDGGFDACTGGQKCWVSTPYES